MTNIQTLIFSALAGVVYAVYQLSKPEYQGEGMGEIAVGLQAVFIAVIIVPIIFGIVSYLLSKEKRLVQALSSLGISLLVMVASVLIVGQLK